MKFLNLCIVVILLFGATACSKNPAATPSPEPVGASIAEIAARYREEIPMQMELNHIPGLAVAVVDGQGILWAEGFGFTDGDGRTPVTPSTLFSIQSMSKSFTATAAMFSAQDGLVDLDAPITTYLPDFTIHSIFEEHPEQKITLRHLLSHTAGLPHEAPYGGNFDHPAYSFEQHIASISDTWLKFPVGTRYDYSNLGIDLAGYILQVRSGMPFTQYVQEKVLDPLGMKGSTLDVQRIRSTAARAIGHSALPLRPPVDWLIIPSGGVWTTAEDMARYLQFHINAGALDGNRLLREDLAETMYIPPNLAATGVGQASSYALGITVHARSDARHFQHSGGGFGFNSSMVWYPEYQLGAVVLTNTSEAGDYYYRLSENVLNSIINDDYSGYTQRAKSFVRVAPAYPPSLAENTLSHSAWQSLIAAKKLPEDAAAPVGAVSQDQSETRMRSCAGTYIWTMQGIPIADIEIRENQGRLFYTAFDSSGELTEVEPGLFIAQTGDTFDVRGAAPTLMNVRMVKADPRTLPFVIGFYAVCGLMFLVSVFFWPVRAILRRLKRRRPAADRTAQQPSLSQGWYRAGILAAPASLLSLACLAITALIPNMVYVPWPRPYIDLAWWQFALLGLPFAGLVLAVGVIVLAALALRRSAGSRTAGWYFFAVGLALLACNTLIVL